MRHFKLDENADPRWRVPLERIGCKVTTVHEEALQGTDDATLAEICQREEMCIITADVGFAQVFEYPPHKYSGLIVLRHPKPSLAGMTRLIEQVAVALQHESPEGKLWVVEPGRIRVHSPHDAGEQ